MKAITWFKSAIGLIYTTIILALIFFAIVWLTQFVIQFSWLGAILFWMFGIPIVIGIFQAIAAILAYPAVYLLKGAKWLSWLLILPVLYFVFRLGAILWEVASLVHTVLGWLLMISWFCETVWLFIAYLVVAMGSAYDTDGSAEVARSNY